jgi:hypothetical protein
MDKIVFREFISNQSVLFSGNLLYRIPDNHPVLRVNQVVEGLNLDKVFFTYHTRDVSSYHPPHDAQRAVLCLPVQYLSLSYLEMLIHTSKKAGLIEVNYNPVSTGEKFESACSQKKGFTTAADSYV